ncbi:TorF family putative porin [Ramlibacter sp. 2FC]|uniref:TorF family putative porin n=1 Tax=Ramlibacter sp. 2FC TaxID=2502188 RepID=UPI0010F600EF|nr:TorF family putative porin [Ramlibacter sp. 2FC]
MTSKSAKVLAVAALAALPMLASAQLTANVSLTSNYKFRGQDQDQSRTKTFKPAIQGGFDYAFGGTGFYVGNWNSSVDWLSGNSLESDVYGGYKFSSGALGFDVGVLAYLYPGNNFGNTTELYGAVSYGPFTAKYSHTVSDGYFGVGKATDDGKGTGYLNLAYAQEVAKNVTLKASVGFTNFKAVTGAADYTDYSVGASYDFGGGVSLTGAVVGANKKASYPYAIDASKSVNKSALIVTLTKTL